MSVRAKRPKNGWFNTVRKDSNSGKYRPIRILMKNGQEIQHMWLDKSGLTTDVSIKEFPLVYNYFSDLMSKSYIKDNISDLDISADAKIMNRIEDFIHKLDDEDYSNDIAKRLQTIDPKYKDFKDTKSMVNDALLSKINAWDNDIGIWEFYQSKRIVEHLYEKYDSNYKIPISKKKSNQLWDEYKYKNGIKWDSYVS